MQIENQQILFQNSQTFFQDNKASIIGNLSLIATSTLSFNDSQLNLESNSVDYNQQKFDSQNSTQIDFNLHYLSFKNIKSKEEIEFQSKQNQQILFNLNSNIEDLFKKISSLTEQIHTEIQPKQLKERSLSIINHQKNIKEKDSYNQKISTKIKSLPQIQFPQYLAYNQNKRNYQPIFFQLQKNNEHIHSINMKLFQTGKSLGSGKFGEVMQCRNITTNHLFALKKIFKSVIQDYGMQDQLLTELKILTQIDHPNIIKAYESFTDEFHIFILMQYAHGDVLTKKFNSSEKQVKKIIKQVLQAIKYLHQKRISHRDIKPENIILMADNIVKICDFGWAYQGDNPMNVLCGTLDYVSPEMVDQKEYSHKIDLWNVGVMTYELLHGYPPFKSSSKQKIFERVKNLEYQFSEQLQLSQECKNFIKGFLKYQKERQSIEWGLNHEFLRTNESQELEMQENSQHEIIDQFSPLLNSF